MSEESETTAQQRQVQQHAQQQQQEPEQQVLNLDKIDRIDIPQFWTQKLQLWFTAVEAQFMIKRITADSTKYYMVITKLDQDALTVVEHIVGDPPAQEKYAKIKDALLKHYSVSNERKIRTLISGLELGNKRPSDLLAEISRLGGPQLDTTFAKTLWLDRLPQYVQIALAAADGLSNEGLGQLADKILEIQQLPSSPYLMAVEQKEQQNACIEKLTKQLEMLTTKVDQITMQQHSRSRARSRSSRHHQRRQSSKKLCFYHSRFGERAVKCTQPCSWVQQQGNEQRPQ